MWRPVYASSCSTDLAEHASGAAIGLAELEQGSEPLVALMREQAEQQEHGPAERHGGGLRQRRQREREADRREQDVDQVDPGALGELLAKRRPSVQPFAGARGERVAGELSRECGEQDEERDLIGRRTAGGHQHQTPARS